MKISAAEGRVLDVLWRLGPADAGQIVGVLAQTEGWGDPTVRTLLRRLIAKKAVSKAKDGKRPVYEARIAQADYAHAESENLIDRFYEGRLSPLVLQFSQRRKLEKDDLEALKRLIEALDHDR